MFVICSHYNEKYNPIYDCVESIRNLYRQETIFVVDTGSESKEYLNELNKFNNIKILHSGPNYELGAWKKVLYSYDLDYYVCIQDSVKLLNRIDHIFDKEFYSYHIVTEGLLTMPSQNVQQMIDSFNDYDVKFNNISVLFGCMFMINNEIKNKLINSNFFMNFLPKNKIDSYICERILYSLFENLGCNVINSSLNKTEHGDGPFFSKKWLNRI
jgi:hypothetical protein